MRLGDVHGSLVVVGQAATFQEVDDAYRVALAHDLVSEAKAGNGLRSWRVLPVQLPMVQHWARWMMIIVKRLREAAVMNREDGVYALLVEAAEVIQQQANFILEQDERAAWENPTRWTIAAPPVEVDPCEFADMIAESEANHDR